MSTPARPCRRLASVALAALAATTAARAQQDCRHFLPAETEPGPNHALAVASDLDGDGDLDVATPAGLLVNRGDGTFDRVALPFVGDLRGFAVADLDADGAPDLVVSSFLLDTVQVWRNLGGLVFTGLAPVAAGDGPCGLEAGDVDVDGDLDVAVASLLSLDARVLVNQGGGVLVPGAPFATGMGSLDVAFGDFHPDGDLDLLVSGENPSLVVTFRNDGAGNFAQVAQIGISNNWARTVQAARIDADADLDAVVTLANGNGLVVFSNPGNGIMTNFTVLPTAGRTYSAAVGDVDLDGDPDLLAVTGTDFGGLAFFRNTGNGVYAAAEERPCLAAQGVVLGRFDLDGRLDAVVTTGTQWMARTLRFPGDAAGLAFEPEIVPLALGPTFQVPESFTGADVEGDGDLDLIVAGFGSGVLLLRNDGVAGFAPVSLPTPGGYGAMCVRAGDLDGDGDPDLVAGAACGGCGAFTLLNSGGSFTVGQSLPSPSTLPDLALDDLDFDGDLDVLLLTAGSPPQPFPPFPGQVITYRNDGTGTFGPGFATGTGTLVTSITAGDFDGDGRGDVVVGSNTSTGPLHLHLRLANGFLGPAQPLVAPTAVRTVRAVDLDGDLAPDLALGLTGGVPSAIAILRNLGGGAFAAPQPIPGIIGTYGSAGALATGDLDGDGDADLAVTSYDGTLIVVENQGGTYLARTESSGVVARSLAVLDVNQDARADLVVGYGGHVSGQSLLPGLALLVQEPPCATYTPFCFGDGTGTPCPCGNTSPVGGGAGCRSSIGAGAVLDATGTPSLAADTLELRAFGMPATTSALFVQGSTTDGAGLGNPLADGLRCVLGTVVRLGTRSASLGAATYGAPAGDVPVSVRGGIVQPGTVAFYQAYYRNVAPFCTPATANLTNGLAVTWRP